MGMKAYWITNNVRIAWLGQSSGNDAVWKSVERLTYQLHGTHLIVDQNKDDKLVIV
jgi:hypothetical protein